MIAKVHEHKIKIEKSPVNELEVNVTKMQFVFDETIPSNYVKKAFFTNGNVSKIIELVNDECNIPVEVLHKKGQVRLGVIAYEVQDETLIERFNPSPDYFEVWEGSMVEADNTEPITPTDKEQIEQMLSNINIDGNKSGKITTITITHKDGTTQTLQVLDGEKGQKGDTGAPGAVKAIKVNELPTENIQTDAMYLVPSTTPGTKNLYDEYMYIDDQWEIVGRNITIDLQDYVKNTDYATSSKGGVIKTGPIYGTMMRNDGYIIAVNRTYEQYQNDYDGLIIGKRTLENVITGKGLTTKSYVDGLVGNIATILDSINGESVGD